MSLAATAAGAPVPLDISAQGAPVFTVYSARDGLSDEIWNTVAVASDGFAWAGSASELARFDGYRWRLWPFPQARSLVRQVAQLPDGSFWAIFEREGLARYADGEWRLEPTQAGRLFNISLVEGPDGPEAWLGTEAGLLRRTGAAWVADPGNGDGLGNYVNLEYTTSLFGGPRQWLLTDASLRYRELVQGRAGPWRSFEDPQLAIIPGTDLLRTVDGEREELWVLSYGAGITRLRADGVRSWRAADGGLPTEAIYMARATHDSDGRRNLWVASRAGLLRLRGEQFEVYDRRHGLPSDAVRSVEVVHSEGADQLWLATEGGIVRASLGASQWRTVSLLGARENGIFGVLVEPDGRGGERLWAGSFKEGLALLEDSRWRQFTQADGTLPAVGVRMLQRLVGPDRQWWRVLGLVDGSVHRISDDLRLERIPVPWVIGSGELPVYALSREHAGAVELWFATLRSGAYRWRDGRWTQFLADPDRGAVMQLLEQVDRQGKSWLWAASGRGLARFDGERWTELRATLGLPEDSYRSLALVDEGGHAVLWIGSNRYGILRVAVDDPAAPAPAPAAAIPPPPDPTVYSTLADRQGRIYVCTNNGVQQLTPTAAGYASRVFRRRDGLVHDECNTHSQFVDSADRYWAGTLGGLGVFDPQIRTANTSERPRPLRWIDLQVDGADVRVPPDAVLWLPPGVGELRVGYALLTGEREDESRYRAVLHGYDAGPAEWSAEHVRNFTRLPAGSYRLVVDARDFRGVRGGPIELRIEVEPHWWQRPLLRALLALLGLLVAVALVLLYNRNLRQRQRRLQAEVAARTAELDTANRRLTELSYSDPLTGVANRRRLNEALEVAVERALSRGLPLGVVVIDVDHFKEYNDRHGHLAGDAALRAVAHALESARRQQDLVARYGGEEFACLLVDADPQATLAVAERMRALVEALPPRTLGNDEHTVTISAGVWTGVPAAGATPADLLARADAALFQAKRDGRNRVRLA